MKKATLIFILLAVFATFGCKEDISIEGRITKAMKEYAKKNFDDPKSLQEVAMIEADNVFDTQKLITELLTATAQLDSIYEKRYDSLHVAMEELLNSGKKPKEVGLVDRFLLMNRFNEHAGGVLNSLNDKKMRDFYYKEVDSLLKYDTLYPITTYNINVRVKENGELKIKHFYTWYCDTTTIFEIFDKPIPQDYFEKEKRIFDECEKFTEYGEKRRDFIDEGINLYRELYLMLE